MTIKNNDESGVLYTKQVARPFSSHDLLVDLTSTASKESKEIRLQSSTISQVKGRNQDWPSHTQTLCSEM